MKRTHKFGALGDVATIVREAPSISAAARKLGVERSTVHRWIADGKVPKPGGSPLSPVANIGSRKKGAPQTPEEWASAVRKAYPLDPTQDVLVDLAVQALMLSRNMDARPEAWLAAMGRFQQLVRQLHLEDGSAAGASIKPRAVPVRVVSRAIGDPRAALMAAK